MDYEIVQLIYRYKLNSKALNTAVCKSPGLAYDVAKIKGPEPWLEEAISRSSRFSCVYAIRVKKDRFELGEPAIFKDSDDAFDYIHYFQKEKWIKELEPYIAENTKHSFSYANIFTKKPFPAGEPAIAENAYYSYIYAKNNLKGRFYKGEEAIKTDSDVTLQYIIDVLKEPVKEFEDVLIKEQNKTVEEFDEDSIDFEDYLAWLRKTGRRDHIKEVLSKVTRGAR